MKEVTREQLQEKKSYILQKIKDEKDDRCSDCRHPYNVLLGGNELLLMTVLKIDYPFFFVEFGSREYQITLLNEEDKYFQPSFEFVERVKLNYC